MISQVEWNPDYLEYCEIMVMEPDPHDQMLFMAGMTFQSLKDNAEAVEG